MEFFQLHTFLVISEVGSLTKAADRLCLTQPAISRQIQALEASLGVVLFERVNRGMRLTDAGIVLHKYAKSCIALMEDCKQAMEEIRMGSSGRILLGVGGTHPMYELPGLLQGFSKRFPDVEISVRTGRSKEIISAVCDRQLDLAFVRTTVADPDIKSIDLYEEPIILVSQPGQYPENVPLNLDDILNASLILFPKGTSFRNQIDTALADAQIIPRISLETDSVEEMRHFVAMGMGVAFLPASAVNDDIKTRWLIEIQVNGLPKLVRRTSLIYLCDRYQSAATRAFIKGIVD
ncbi:MAG: LysR family transcriptional regulator [Armatimonadota bacterium]